MGEVLFQYVIKVSFVRVSIDYTGDERNMFVSMSRRNKVNAE